MASQYGGPPPLDSATAQAAHSNQTTSSQNTSHSQHKRNQRHRKNHSQSYAQNDGAVSDSVMHSLASPQANKNMKQRHQSVAVATPHKHTSQFDKVNEERQRPASLGGNMLLGTPAAKEQAYAGPTFQASPAPSSLPVPKFFSRSVPNVAGLSLSARMKGEETPDKEDSSPEPDIVGPHSPSRNGQKSPLDLFFNADREEKERSRSSSSLSPEMAARPPPPATEPRKLQQFDKYATSRMGGDSDSVISPQTISPNKKYHLTERPTPSPNATDTASDAESEREAQTKALKDLLFSNFDGLPQSSATPPVQQHIQQDDPGSEQIFGTPSPYQRSTSGPSTPAPSTEQQNHYSLHYGNRNLSPLFKASRNETPSRPSGLRQQELPGDFPTSTMPPQPHHIDPNSFSRRYINEHVRSSAPAPVPNIALTNGTNPNLPPYSTGPSQQHGGIQNGTANNGSNSGASPRSINSSTGENGGARDIKGMENDLRKMLNLNVLSN